MTPERRNHYRMRRPVGAPIVSLQTELITELAGQLARTLASLRAAHGPATEGVCSCPYDHCVLTEPWARAGLG